ncbi:MAG: hypothetical protein AAF890_03265, partial [Pseudomonadota bacterium]
MSFKLRTHYGEKAMFGNWSVSGLITMAMLVPLQPATASDRFNNYLKITVLNSNRAMKPIDDGRFLRTLADYERRLKLPEGDACDPRGVRPIRGAKPIYLRNGGPGGLTKCKRGIQRRHPSPTNFNFRTRWNPATHAYEDDYMHKDRRTVRLGILRDKTKKRWTRKRYHCIWTINGVTDNRRQPCRTYKRELGFGTHSAKAVIWRGKRKITTTGTYSFTLSDFKLVAVGDSFGSGEGNPHRYPSAFSGGLYYVKPALWLDPRCHRSLFSSSGIASALIANLNGSARNLGDRTSNLYSVSSMNFACSGASTDFGLNKKYGGKLSAYQVSKLWTDLGEKPNLPTEMFFRGTPPPARRLRAGTSRNPTPPDLPSQFQQIKDHLCKKNGQNELTCRRPDALLFYMGINDVGFADQLIQLIKRCDRKPNCLAGREKLVTKGLEKVTANLREFDRRLKKSKLSSESSKNIYIVEYPNPLSRNKRNDFCNDLKKLREKNNKPLVPYARF